MSQAPVGDAGGRPLKIIGVTSFMNAAGAQEALLRIGRQMRARGHQMQVWFLYEEAPVFRGEPHTYTFIEKPKLSPLEYLKVFFALTARIRREKPDLVVGFLPLGQVFGALAAALAGVDARIASQRAPGPTFGKVMRLLDKAWGTIGVYRRIICVSQAVADSFSDYPAAYRRKLQVIHNGIEWPDALPDRAEARRKWGLRDGEVAVLALGRMKTQKNYPFMLDRIADVPGVTLLIGGDGELRGQLEAQVARLSIQDRVRFLGNVDRAGVLELLSGCDVFIQTSTYEGQSNAVLEAMNAGQAIIVSDIPMQRETLEDGAGGVTARLVPLDDPSAWTRELGALRDDPELRRSLGASAKALVTDRFGLERMADAFEKAFRATVRGQ